MIIDRWQGSSSFRFPLDYSPIIFSWPFLFYPGNSSIQEIEINGLKKCALDLVFMWSIHPPACLGQLIYSEHGSKVGKEFNTVLISLKHLITLQRRGYLQLLIMVRVLTETFISTASKEKIQCAITAVFNNTRTLKFKSEQTIGFFAAVNHLSGPLGNQKFVLMSWKDHGFWLVDFVVFCVLMCLMVHCLWR